MHLWTSSYGTDMVRPMQTTIITPETETSWWVPPVRDVWCHHELFLMFVRRQFLVRYKQSILGVLWSVLTPLASLFVFWLLFGLLLKVPSEGYPYVVFAFAGLIPWTAFSSSSLSISTALLEQMGIVSKIYFPRILLPLVTFTREALDACITMALLIVFCMLCGYSPTWRILFLPAVMLGALTCGLALGLLFAGPMVRYRDLKIPLNYAVQLAMYITPVIYPSTLIPERWQWVMELNPMHWVIQASRWSVLGQPVAVTPILYISIALVALALVAGWFVFAVFERQSVDVQ